MGGNLYLADKYINGGQTRSMALQRYISVLFSAGRRGARRRPWPSHGTSMAALLDTYFHPCVSANSA